MTDSFGESGFPTIFQSKCIAYNGIDTYSSVNLNYSGSGSLLFAIGSSDSISGTIVWQEVSINTNTTLTSPNKALFYKIVGTSGSYVTDIRIKYS